MMVVTLAGCGLTQAREVDTVSLRESRLQEQDEGALLMMDVKFANKKGFAARHNLVRLVQCGFLRY